MNLPLVRPRRVSSSVGLAPDLGSVGRPKWALLLLAQLRVGRDDEPQLVDELAGDLLVLDKVHADDDGTRLCRVAIEVESHLVADRRGKGQGARGEFLNRLPEMIRAR